MALLFPSLPEYDYVNKLNKLAAGVSPHVVTYGAMGDGATNDTPAFQSAIDSIASSAHGTFLVPAGTYLLSTSPTIAGKTVAWILDPGVMFTGSGVLPGTVQSFGDPAPASTGINSAYWEWSNGDGATPTRWRQHIPSSVNMTGGGAVQGCGLIFTGDTSAQTPSAGFAETNMIRFDYTVNSAAGSKVQIHLINGLLTLAADEAGSGVEHAGFINTTRVTGPTSGTAAMGAWGGDVHVEKASSVLDGKMVGLEVGVHKAPALGSAKCIGLDVWSGDRSGITATRAGDAIRLSGNRGWTNFLKALYTDNATVVAQIDQNGNLTLNNPTGSGSHTFAATQASSAQTLTLTSKDAGSVNCNLILQSSSGGHIIGSTTNEHVILKQNNAEVFRLISGFLLNTVSGIESTGAGSAALGSNCPASTLTAPYKWIKARTSDASTVYIPAWK